MEDLCGTGLHYARKILTSIRSGGSAAGARAGRDTFHLPVSTCAGGHPMQRRTFINATASAAAVLAFKPLALAREQEHKNPVVYPDPAIEVVDPRFAKYKIGNAAVERLYTGTRWSEGPVWFADGRYLIWSDIPNNRMLRWLEETGEVSVFRNPSNYSNGNHRDRQGRLVTC